MTETKLAYLDDMFRYEGTAHIEDMDDSDGKTVLVLDETIFYPQGGGQASDTGRIEGDGLNFSVQSVTYSSGKVMHLGVALAGQPTASAVVQLFVDVRRRKLNSSLQSAGHLLLNAMANIGQPLVATKGFHFPEGPYVEFKGAIPEGDRGSVLDRLQAEVDHLISRNLPITWQFVDSDRLAEICKNVPQNVPKDKPTRIVTIDGLSQPCGGTHVHSSGDLKGLRVEKISLKKGDTRISYSLPRFEQS